MVSIGKVVHVFLVGTFGIETAALTEFGNKIGGTGGGNCTAVLQCRSYSLSGKFFCSKFKIRFLVVGQERQVCQGCSGGDIGLLSNGNHVGDKAYPIFHFYEIRRTYMLAKLNRTMAGVRLKVQFVVAIASESIL